MLRFDVLPFSYIYLLLTILLLLLSSYSIIHPFDTECNSIVEESPDCT